MICVWVLYDGNQDKQLRARHKRSTREYVYIRPKEHACLRMKVQAFAVLSCVVRLLIVSRTYQDSLLATFERWPYDTPCKHLFAPMGVFCLLGSL